ncbi:hypothetical protein [Salinimicrobium gaetbulicola]|uniref:Lipoprotein n=1 Tax=Salinimicrobium gaetbulicola TaxID=999702 RepID=A0ABW3ICE4_9FLAO
MKSLRFNFFLFLLAILISCSKNDDSSNGENLSIEYDRYIVWTTNDQNYSVGVELNTLVQDYATTMCYCRSGCSHSPGPGFTPVDESMPAADVYFTNFNDGNCAGYDENVRFNDSYQTGSYKLTTDDYEKGIYIDISLDFSDPSTHFTSSIGDQPSSSYVKITNSEPDNREITSGYFNFGQIVTGEFQARLYNWDDPSKFIDVKNGHFKLRVQSFQDGRLDKN